ncbi:unnamed protein product [Rotaria sp. Silwood1]|nr:unnamed protein product [Rotaria sp. Silwood1]CAF5017305.1 unnamed protein product [Rotaria sp. Silwood1]
MASIGLISDVHVVVDMDHYSISYTSIETRSLSSCVCLSLDGIIGTKPFCLLSHISRHQELEGDNLYHLLVDLLRNLSEQLNTSLQINSLSSEKTQIKKLKRLIGGGPIGHHVLARKSFIMLNDNSDSIVNEIESLTSEKDVIYLVNELLNSVIVIPPITYLTTHEHETKGQLIKTRGINLYLLFVYIKNKYK